MLTIEQIEATTILRRAYTHIARRCMRPCDHTEWPSQQCSADKSKYPLTHEELHQVRAAILHCCGLIG